MDRVTQPASAVLFKILPAGRAGATSEVVMKTRNKLLLGGLAAGALFAGTAGSVAVVVAARRALDGFGRLRRGRGYDAFGLRWLGEGEDLRGQTVLITGGS